jgi:hypothetical protein
MDCSPNPSDIVIIQGNNFPPARWQCLASENPDVIFPLDGNIIKLQIIWPGGSLNASSDTPAIEVDLATSIISWNYTIAQSRTLPRGRLTSYELERWEGAIQQTIARGAVIVSPGDNPD